MSVPEFLVIAGALITAIASVVVATRNGTVELKKRKPETITHRCRVADIDVYTFIKGDKKQTPPLCAYLDPSNYHTCWFDPAHHRTEAFKPDALRLKEINQSQCYIAQFNEEHDLI